MVKKFLKELREDLLHEKMELESREKQIKAKIQENAIFLQKMKEENDQNYDVFSPRKQNVKWKEKIHSLEREQEKLEQEANTLALQLDRLHEKRLDLDAVISIVRQKESDEKKSVSNETEKQEERILSDVVHRLEFCLQLMELDMNRCKVELAAVIKKIRDREDAAEVWNCN